MSGKRDKKKKGTKEDVSGLLDKIKELPVEDILWGIKELDGYETEESTRRPRRWGVMDTNNDLIYLSREGPGKKSLTDQVRNTLESAMFKPFCGKPRRPRFLQFYDFDPSGLQLKPMGITLFKQGVPRMRSCHEGIPTGAMHMCSTCHRRGEIPLFFACPDCLAVNYCSQKCLEEQRTSKGPMSHINWCAKMKVFMSRSQVLEAATDFPFTYSKEVTALDFYPWKEVAFLKRYGLYRKGLWRRDSVCLGQHISDKPECLEPVWGELPDEEDMFVLPQETELLMSTPVNPPKPIDEPLRNWADYYSWRGFQLDSPIAILMTGPLTIYYIITTLLKQDHPDNFQKLQKSKSLWIDLVGIEKEADLVPVYLELGALLPADYRITLVLIGSDISKKVDGTVTEKDNLKIIIKKGFYHSVSRDKIPDVVIGLNAGLAAYTAWMETLGMIAYRRIPAYFTDFTESSCVYPKIPVESMGIGTVTDPVINPFRCPTRRYPEVDNLPTCCNSFTFTLKYDARSTPPSKQPTLQMCWNPKCPRLKSGGSFDVQLKKCTRCYQALYCNKECQKQDWWIHKSLCPKLSGKGT